jgi:hypothetical protein
MKKMQKILLIARDSKNLQFLKSSLDQEFNESSYTQFSLTDNLNEKSAKEVHSKTLTHKLATFIREVYLSNYFYSYYHSAIERRCQRKPLSLIVALILKRLFNDKYIKERYVNDFIEYVCSIGCKKRIEKLNIPNPDVFDIIVFHSIFSTSIEIDIYTYVQNNKSVRTILVPYNWDNPTSKIFYVNFKFDCVYVWGEQMKSQLREVFESRRLKIKTPPRFGNVKSSKLLAKKNIVVFGSQKGENIARIIEQIAILGYTVVYKPHPYKKTTLEKILALKSQFPNVLFDPHTEWMLLNNVIPDSDAFVFNDLLDLYSHKVNEELIWDECLLVVSAAGTSLLDGVLRGIPGICLVAQPKQVTIKLSVYMTHFEGFSDEDFIGVVHNYNSLSNKIKYILDLKFNSKEIIKKSQYYCKTSLNLLQ